MGLAETRSGSLAKMRSGLKSWNLGASLAKLGRGEERSLADASKSGEGGDGDGGELHGGSGDCSLATVLS